MTLQPRSVVAGFPVFPSPEIPSDLRARPHQRFDVVDIGSETCEVKVVHPL